MRRSGRTTRGIEAAHLFASMGFRVFYLTAHGQNRYVEDLYRSMEFPMRKALTGAPASFEVNSGTLLFRPVNGAADLVRGHKPERTLIMLDHAVPDEDISEELRAFLLYFSQALHR